MTAPSVGVGDHPPRVIEDVGDEPFGSALCFALFVWLLIGLDIDRLLRGW